MELFLMYEHDFLDIIEFGNLINKVFEVFFGS